MVLLMSLFGPDIGDGQADDAGLSWSAFAAPRHAIGDGELGAERGRR
jgi:hypothetical protein